MEAKDQLTTTGELKAASLRLALEKGWGDENGIQNPQCVAMAMSVEMAELLEHFQWMNAENVADLLAGKSPKKVDMIAEELADVFIYGLHLANALNIDVAGNIVRKLDIVRKRNYQSE